MNERKQGVSRRSLLAGAAATAGLTIVQARSVAGTQANSMIELGIIGSGRRGYWIGKLFQQDGRYRVVALADVFDDQMANAQKELKLADVRRYKGMKAYKELLASKVDAVAIESPPYCHAEQAAAAVDAGKHVYLAKPVATDVPGCRMVMDAGRKAADKLSFWVDFQTRVTDNFMEAAKRVHDGAIGRPFAGQAFYYCTAIPYKGDISKKDPETRMRNWIHDIALSGDILVEQNIHATDVADWLMGGHALKAFGTGGRKVRTEYGDCWDHYIVTFWYPNGALIDFSSSQCNKGYNDIGTRIFGSKGTVDTRYRGKVEITGDNPWNGGERPEMFTTGAAENVKRFGDSLLSGKPINNSEPASHSTLTAILGRIAAKANRVISWEEMMERNERLEPNVEL